jgi:Uma2 family endonuclease
LKFHDEKKDTVLNPQLIVEVLSKNSESSDRGKKFEYYRKINSLKEYVIVSSDHYLVEVYSKNISNQWILADEIHLEGSVKIPSLNLQIPMKEIYSKIEFQNSKQNKLFNE